MILATVMLFALAKVRAPSWLTAPILPTTEISPPAPALNVILPPPFNVLKREIFAPAAAVLRLAVPETVTALLN